MSHLSRILGISDDELKRNYDLLRRHYAGELLTYEEFQRVLKLFDPPRAIINP